MNDEIDNILSGKLHDYRLAPPEGVLRQVERTLSLSAKVKRRRTLLWGFAGGAAAAVALLVLLLPGPTDTPRQLAAVTPETTGKQERGGQLPTKTIAPTVEPVKPAEAAAPTTKLLRSVRTMAMNIDEPADPALRIAGSPSVTGSQHEVSLAGTGPGTGSQPGGAPTERQPEKEYPANDKPADRYESHATGDYSPLPERRSYNPLRAHRRGRTRIMASLYAANFSGGSNVGADPGSGDYRLMEVVTRATDRETQIRSDITSVNHSVPVAFGMGVAFGLNPRLSLETGINYTGMRSEMKVSGIREYSMRQQLHYVGVPVALMWRFADAGPVGLYVRGGGMLEKGVKGTLRTTLPGTNYAERKDVGMPGLQPSLNASLGLHISLGRTVGLYLEPGVNYYPDMPDRPMSYRTENPVTFGLRAGLRFSVSGHTDIK